MRKTTVITVLALVTGIAFSACGRGFIAPANGTVPAMEGTAATEAAAESFAVTEPQNSEASGLTEAAAVPFSAGATALPTAAVDSIPPAPPPKAQAVQPAATPAKTPVFLEGTTKPTGAAPSQAAPPPAAIAPYVPPATTTTARPTTATQPTTVARPTTSTTTTAPTTRTLTDYESMGQAGYQTKVIEALNALRAGRGLAPMAPSAELTASTLAQAQKMAAAGKSFHTEGFPPGFESVAHVPYNFSAQLLGEMLTNHVQNFLMDGYSNVGIAVVRDGNRLYCVMQGN